MVFVAFGQLNIVKATNEAGFIPAFFRKKSLNIMGLLLPLPPHISIVTLFDLLKLRKRWFAETPPPMGANVGESSEAITRASGEESPTFADCRNQRRLSSSPRISSSTLDSVTGDSFPLVPESHSSSISTI
jgi:hypothetical protein